MISIHHIGINLDEIPRFCSPMTWIISAAGRKHYTSQNKIQRPFDSSCRFPLISTVKTELCQDQHLIADLGSVAQIVLIRTQPHSLAIRHL